MALDREWQRRDKGRLFTVWTLSLAFHGARQPLSFLMTRDELAARRGLERFAGLLESDAVDRTREPEKRIPWERL